MKYRHGRKPRTGRVSLPGHIYLITTVTDRRRPLFTDLFLARTAIRALHFHDRQGGITTLAFILMPDHLHWLVQLHEGTLSVVVRRFKGFSAREINLRRGVEGRVWQAGFHDHALRKDEDVRNAARYLVANPLRAGLVDNIEEYPHWDAIWMGGSDFV